MEFVYVVYLNSLSGFRRSSLSIRGGHFLRLLIYVFNEGSNRRELHR
jgi:hypothetical protein